MNALYLAMQAALLVDIAKLSDRLKQFEEVAPPELWIKGVDLQVGDPAPVDSEWLPNGLSRAMRDDGGVLSKIREDYIATAAASSNQLDRDWAAQALHYIMIPAALDRTDLTDRQRRNIDNSCGNAQGWAASRPWFAFWGFEYIQHPGGRIERGAAIKDVAAYPANQVDLTTGAVTWHGAIPANMAAYCASEKAEWIASRPRNHAQPIIGDNLPHNGKG